MYQSAGNAPAILSETYDKQHTGQEPSSALWLPSEDDYGLALAALGDLGFGQSETEGTVPAFEVVRDAFELEDSMWLRQQIQAGYDAKLVLSPSIERIGLTGNPATGEPGLVSRFDEKQGRFNKTRASKHWQSLPDKSPLHDNGFRKMFSTAVILVPEGTPHLYNETIEDVPAGQIFRSNAPVTVKRAALAEERSEEPEANRGVLPATISQIITAEAQARHAGNQSTLQNIGSVCLVHYPEFQIGNLTCLPTIFRDKRRMNLSERWVDIATEKVLRVLQVESVAQPEKIK